MMKRGNTYKETLKGRSVLVVGLGKSGKAAAKALKEAGAAVTVQDSKTADKLDTQFMQYMQNEGIRSYLGSKPEDMSAYDMLVLSPGVPPALDYIQNAKDSGAEIIGELELAYRLGEGNFVAITGTNGKTTTTTLVGEIFKASGRNTAVVGNIGNPVVTEAVNSTEEDWLVTEVSSFQLETADEFRPVVSAILNLTPDHLNRHGTMEAYGAAKAKVAANQTSEEFLVINLDDSAAYALAKDTKATVIPFSRREKPDAGAYLDGTKIIVKDLAGTEHYICDTSDLRIIGDHNVENVLAASAIAFFAGIDPEVITAAVKEFPGVEHRIEFCGRVDDVDYYNDSKGTNVDAAVIAIKALRDGIILIAGGDGKGQEFDGLAEHFDGAVEALILLGRDAPIIEEAARKAGFTNIYNCKDMPDCVRTAARIARPGEKVLLSPACASWDMYANFEQRGKHFKQCIKEMLK
jgi:UDP-N-acetylmuramoylalanine--D-glutamate ligase